jgi:hypothetical protein
MYMNGLQWRKNMLFKLKNDRPSTWSPEYIASSIAMIEAQIEELESCLEKEVVEEVLT